MYYGSMWKDYAVWQAAPWIAHRLGATTRVRGRVRQRLVRHAGRAARRARHARSPRRSCRRVLVVAACRESYLLDYDERALALHVQLRRRRRRRPARRRTAAATSCSAATAITDGSFSLQVKVPSGGSVVAERRLPLPRRRRSRGDEGRARRGVAAELRRRGARARSSAAARRSADVGYLCGIHMKRSMHRALLAELGIDDVRAAYLDDTGHMSGVDPLLALDRAARAGELRDGELVLLLAAGTGYTWAASVVRWGDDRLNAGERSSAPRAGSRSRRRRSTRSPTRPATTSGSTSIPSARPPGRSARRSRTAT